LKYFHLLFYIVSLEDQWVHNEQAISQTKLHNRSTQRQKICCFAVIYRSGFFRGIYGTKIWRSILKRRER